MPKPRRIYLHYLMQTSMARRITLGLIDFRNEHRLQWTFQGPVRGQHHSALFDASLSLGRNARGYHHCAERTRLALALLDPSESESFDAYLPFDLAEAGRQVAQHFLDRGFRAFARLSHSGQEIDNEQYLGFEQYLREAGCEISLVPPTGDVDGVLSWMRSLEQPTALFSSNDSFALRIIELATEAGLDVPRDLAVVGSYNGELDCELSPITLSSVRWDSFNVGRRIAASMQHFFETGLFRNPAPFTPLAVVSRRSSDIVSTNDPALNRIVQHIIDNISMPLQVSSLVNRAGMSRSALERRFRDTLGETPGQFIRRQRLRRAKELIRSTDHSLDRIADACGLSEPRLLHALFQTFEGCSPGQWRRRYAPLAKVRTDVL